MKIHKKVFKDTNRYLMITLFSNIANFARNFAVARLLGPYLTGLCMNLLIIPQTVVYLNLGLPDALTFIVPYNRGKSNDEYAVSVKNKIFSFITFIALIAFAVVLLFVLIFHHLRINIYFIYAALFAFLGQFIRFFTANFAAERNFVKLGWVEFSYAALLLVLSILLIIPFKAHGFWLALIITNIAIIIYSLLDYLKHSKISFVSFNLKEINSLYPLGIVMTLSAAIYIPFINLSKLFITATIDVQSVGYFVLSIFIISIISIIPKTISRVVMPHMSAMRGSEENFGTIYGLFFKTQLYTLGLAFFTVLLGFIFIGPVVRNFLPKYIAGIPAARIMLIAALPYCLIDNANNLLIVTHNKKNLLRIFVVVLIAQLAALVLLMFYKVNILNISLSLVIVFTLYAFLLNYQVFRLKKSAL